MNMRRRLVPAVMALMTAATVSTRQATPARPATINAAIYREGWIDLNKNGRKDVYEDPAAGVEKRIDDLLAQMSVDEKTCQLATLYGYNRVLKDKVPTPQWKTEVWKDGIGNIDEHCNGVRGAGQDCAQPASRHAEVMNTVQRFFIEETRLGIPADFTNEGIRGLCHWGATSFPAQIGQGCAWDPGLVREIGRVEGREARAVGFTGVGVRVGSPGLSLHHMSLP